MFLGANLVGPITFGMADVGVWVCVCFFQHPFCRWFHKETKQKATKLGHASNLSHQGRGGIVLGSIWAWRILGLARFLPSATPKFAVLLLNLPTTKRTPERIFPQVFPLMCSSIVCCLLFGLAGVLDRFSPTALWGCNTNALGTEPRETQALQLLKLCPGSNLVLATAALKAWRRGREERGASVRLTASRLFFLGCTWFEGQSTGKPIRVLLLFVFGGGPLKRDIHLLPGLGWFSPTSFAWHLLPTPCAQLLALPQSGHVSCVSRSWFCLAPLLFFG